MFVASAFEGDSTALPNVLLGPHAKHSRLNILQIKKMRTLRKFTVALVCFSCHVCICKLATCSVYDDHTNKIVVLVECPKFYFITLVSAHRYMLFALMAGLGHNR